MQTTSRNNEFMTKKVDKVLDELHIELAQTLLDRVRSGEAKASDLNVARQFLKDNGIEGLPVENTPLKDLVDELPFEEENVGGTI
mgnify:CR=1 FL=1